MRVQSPFTPAFSLIWQSSSRTGEYWQLSRSSTSRQPSQNWLKRMDTSSRLVAVSSNSSSWREEQSTGTDTQEQPSRKKPTTAYSKCVKRSSSLTRTSPLRSCWQFSKRQELKGEMMRYCWSTGGSGSRQNTCLFLRSSRPFRATNATQYFWVMAVLSIPLMMLRLSARNLKLQAGMPVISSNASSGESPLARSKDPICLHHPFSRTSGHNSTPFTILRQTKESDLVGMRSSMTSGCGSPLQQKVRLQAPQGLASCVSISCLISCARALLRQSRQKTQVRQVNSMLSCVKLVRSMSSFREYTLVRIRQKSNSTESRELSLPSSLNFSSSNTCSLFCSICLATVERRLASQDWLQMERTISSFGSSRVSPQEERALRSGTSKSLERMRGKEQDSLPINQSILLYLNALQPHPSPITLLSSTKRPQLVINNCSRAMIVCSEQFYKMKASLKGLSMGNEKNLRLSQSKLRSVSDLAGQSYPNNSAYLKPEESKEQTKERLVEQNRRLKRQALELAEQMDEILSQEKFKKKYGTGLGEEGDRETHLKRLEARRQEIKIQQLRAEIAVVKKENEYVHDEATVIETENAVRALETELKTLESDRTSFLNVRKEQAKALALSPSDEKYKQKVEKTRAQLAKIKEECKTLAAKTAENEKMLLKTHERTVTKGRRLKEIEEKIKENKEKMRRGNTNIVTIEMISEIESEIVKLETEHKETERVWAQKLANLEAECANRKLEEEKKLIILKDKEKESRLNEIRLKEFKKLIIQSKAEKKESAADNAKEFRSKRNIKYFERELS